MTDQTSADDVARLREIAERVVWPSGLRGDADEMGYHIRNLEILAKRIEAALQAERARVIEETAELRRRVAGLEEAVRIIICAEKNT